MKRKKAAIIGTSNALMRDGWVNQTRAAALQSGWHYANRSIGGSSSLLGAYLLATDDEVRRADRIILDFCINDQVFIALGQATLNHVLGHYASMFHSLKKQKALDRVLVLMFPPQKVDDALFESLCGLFDRIGVRYMDMRPKISEWLGATGRDGAEAYSDAFHFSPALQQHIGELILQDLVTPDAMPGKDMAFRRWLFKRQPLGLVDLAIEAQGQERCQVGTSVIQRSAHRFSQGDQFHVSGALLLLAAHIWATRDSGVVTVRGVDQGFRVHLRRDYSGLFIFDSIFAPVALAERALVEVRNDLTAPFQLMRGQKSSIYDDTGSTVEIIALVGASYPPAQLGEAVRDRLSAPRAASSLLWRVRRFPLSRRLAGRSPD